MPNIRTSPFGDDLWTEKRLFLDRPAVDERELLDGSGHGWCARTALALGPDKEIIDPETCQSGRGCFRSALEPPPGLARGVLRYADVPRPSGRTQDANRMQQSSRRPPRLLVFVHFVAAAGILLGGLADRALGESTGVDPGWVMPFAALLCALEVGVGIGEWRGLRYARFLSAAARPVTDPTT